MLSYCKKLYTSFNKLGGDFVGAFSSSRAKKIAAIGMGAYLACTGATIATLGYYSSKIAIGVFAMSLVEMPVLASIGLVVFGTMGVVSGLATIASIGGIVGITKKAYPEFRKTPDFPVETISPQENLAPTVLQAKAGTDFNLKTFPVSPAIVHNVSKTPVPPNDYFLKNIDKDS